VLQSQHRSNQTLQICFAANLQHNSEHTFKQHQQQPGDDQQEPTPHTGSHEDGRTGESSKRFGNEATFKAASEYSSSSQSGKKPRCQIQGANHAI